MSGQKTVTVILTRGAITILKYMLKDADWYAEKGKVIAESAIDLGEKLELFKDVTVSEPECMDLEEIEVTLLEFKAAQECGNSFFKRGRVSLVKTVRCLIKEFELEF